MLLPRPASSLAYSKEVESAADVAPALNILWILPFVPIVQSLSNVLLNDLRAADKMTERR